MTKRTMLHAGGLLTLVGCCALGLAACSEGPGERQTEVLPESEKIPAAEKPELGGSDSDPSGGASRPGDGG